MGNGVKLTKVIKDGLECWVPEFEKEEDKIVHIRNSDEPRYSKQWRKEHDILFSVSCFDGQPELGMTIRVYDKNGNTRAKIKLDKKMMLDLKEEIDICLGNIRESEED